MSKNYVFSKQTLHLEGRLGSDPKSIQTKSGKPMASVSIALNYTENGANGRETKDEWYRATFLGFLAENALKVMKKGQLVSLDGQLRIDQYVNKAGETVVQPGIDVKEFTILMFNRDEASHGQTRQTQARNDRQTSHPALQTEESMQRDAFNAEAASFDAGYDRTDFDSM